MFSPIKAGPPDPMYELKKRADADTSERKVDLGVGIYRNEEGLYQEPQCIKEVGQNPCMFGWNEWAYKIQNRRKASYLPMIQDTM